MINEPRDELSGQIEPDPNVTIVHLHVVSVPLHHSLKKTNLPSTRSSILTTNELANHSEKHVPPSLELFETNGVIIASLTLRLPVKNIPLVVMLPTMSILFFFGPLRLFVNLKGDVTKTEVGNQFCRLKEFLTDWLRIR